MGHMGETLNLVFSSRDNGTFELQVKESWSGRTITGSFVPPYTKRQLNTLLKRLNNLESDDHELREIGYRLFLALCGSETLGASRRESLEHSVQEVLRNVIQRTLRRRGTVALTLSFAAGCDEFVRYPWELLHNGEHFLLASGVFTLTRALLRPDLPQGNELPVHPPTRMLYIGCSPEGCMPLETERSYEAMERGLSDLIDDGQLFLDRLEPATFDELVRYLSSYGGASALDDDETLVPCYLVHFDGHGAYGRICAAEDCEVFNDADARRCIACGASLGRVKAQTYLCFCDDEGHTRYIDTETLRELFVSSDVRLAVFSACETATLVEENISHRSRSAAVDATLATALVMAQVPAVVAMPFSLQDELSPTFMFHFYEALAKGRTIEEALARARQAMLPMAKHHSWFIPVLYRRVAEGQEGPVALLAGRDTPEEHDLAHLGAPTTFVGRDQELQVLGALITAAARGEESHSDSKEQPKLRPGMHHIALTGPAGIGKSALAFEAVRRNREKFPGGIIGISLHGGKSFVEAMIEIAHDLHISAKSMHTANPSHCARIVLNAYRGLASRELPCLLLLNGFEEVQERDEIGAWHRFLCHLPEQVIVLVTSRSNPAVGMSFASMQMEGVSCRWYEYGVGKMTSADLLKLFAELASASGLDARIHFYDLEQQSILHEICTLLDGYPLGAELIFGAAQPIEGKVYTPEAATRSLEEIRDELQEIPLAGIWAVLEVAYLRLTPPARLLLAYLSALKLPFSREQIVMLVAPGILASARAAVRLEREHYLEDTRSNGQELVRSAGSAIPAELEKSWPEARDELVQASFMQFDGRVYTIHSQVRHFAISHLPQEERRRVHRVAANYYSSLAHPSPEEWFAAFEHLEDAGELQDLQKAVHSAIRASWALRGRGRDAELQAMLRRAEVHALRLGDKTGEGQIQCCLGAILRQRGQYAEALGCLTRSLALHREQNEPDEAGWALYELAMLFREEGRYQQAGKYAQEALTFFRDAGDVNGETWMQMVLGEVSRGYGDYYDAMNHFEHALASFHIQHDDAGYASTLRDRGTVYEALGRYSEALVDYQEALHLFNASGLRIWQAWVLTDQSVVYLDKGDFDLAERTCSEALAIFREQRVRRAEGRALRVLGDVARKRHNYSDARGYYSEAFAIFTDLGDRVDLAWVINFLGTISFHEGDHLLAKEQYERALAIAHEQETLQIECHALWGLGDVARIMRHIADAERYYLDAAAMAKKLDTPAERCAVLHRQGVLRLLQEQYREALDIWVQSLALDRRIGHPERQSLQDKVDALVAERHLEEAFAEFSKRHGLN